MLDLCMGLPSPGPWTTRRWHSIEYGVAES